jgi:hypothetical protein
MEVLKNRTYLGGKVTVGSLFHFGESLGMNLRSYGY